MFIYPAIGILYIRVNRTHFKAIAIGSPPPLQKLNSSLDVFFIKFVIFKMGFSELSLERLSASFRDVFLIC